MINKSRPLRLLCDASTDGLEATLENKQPDGSIRLLVNIRRSTPRHRTELDSFSTRSGMRRVDYPTPSPLFFSAFFLMYANHECLQQISKVGESKPRIQRWMEFLSDYNYRLSYRRERGNTNANFLSRLPLPPTVENISDSSALSDPDDLGVYVIRACDYIAPPCSPRRWPGSAGLFVLPYPIYWTRCSFPLAVYFSLGWATPDE